MKMKSDTLSNLYKLYKLLLFSSEGMRKRARLSQEKRNRQPHKHSKTQVTSCAFRVRLLELSDFEESSGHSLILLTQLETFQSGQMI